MGNSKLRLIAIFDAEGVDRSADFKDFTIEAADADGGFLSHAAARIDDGVDYVMKSEIPQDFSANSTWNTCRTQAGTEWTGYYTAGTSTLVTLDDVTPTEPVLKFTAIVKKIRGAFAGGASNKAVNAVATSPLQWPLTEEPELLTAPPVIE